MDEILILGMGKSGRAVHQVCEQKKIPVSCFDDVEKPERNFQEYICSKGPSLFVVVSPGIPPKHPLVVLAQRHGCQLGTEIDFAFHLFQGKLPPFLGVTGTNGKTTVVEFTAEAATSFGLSAETVGNIGTPLCERLFLDSKPLPDLFVIELSSFQLQYSKTCPLKAGAYLNFAPDHLDWHNDLNEYHAAKSSIASQIVPGGFLFLHTSVPELQSLSKQIDVVTFSTQKETDIGTDGTLVYRQGKKVGALPQRLQGKLLHDTENFLASFGLLSTVCIPYSHIASAWDAFEKGPHRIQLVHTENSVSYWDDSKATNISSTEAAVKFLDHPIVLIAGGVHKGFSYRSWKDVFQGKVTAIVAIGQAKEAIYNDLMPDYPVVFAASLKEAVETAKRMVAKNGHVLLSPGCSSFDMFKNYKDRGDQFQALVRGNI